MRLPRRFRNHRTGGWLLSQLLAAYYRLASVTARYSVSGIEPALVLIRERRPFIVAFWHGRMFMMPALHRRFTRALDLRVLVSPSRDGRMIAQTLAALSIRTIVGSSSRSGLAALRTLHDAIDDGAVVCITPDGPRGPAMCLKPGIVDVARRKGVPIFVVSFSASPAKVINSWDRFVVPLPFSRVVFIVRGPIYVDSVDDPPASRRMIGKIEECLNGATREADQLCGLDPVVPPLRDI